tara:strand:+ start:7601 stop:8902 length:1302 start_codon:yes stop_codon:yes gene_type:complete
MNRKKVLIITYYWPPSGGAGVQRWLKFVKYLPKFGWEPIVFTVQNGEYPVIDNSLFNDVSPNLKVIRSKIWEPYSVYKKLIGRKKEETINSGFLVETEKSKLLENLGKWVRGNFFIPDARKFWIRPSVKTLSSFLIKTPVDLIISSGPPHSTHLIGKQLKSKFNIPWVSDFRDPWTNIDYYKELKLTKWADYKHKILERDVLKSSNLVLTVGNQLKSELIDLGASNVEVIENGFDHEDFTKNDINNLDDKFTIAHIGSFTPSRNHKILWQALKQICMEDRAFKKDFRLKLIGKVDHSVNKSLNDSNLLDNVISMGYLSHEEVIKEQKMSKVLLLMVNNTPNSKGIITGKVFEYIASGRPILVIGPKDGDLSNIIYNTNSGVVCDFYDLLDLKSTIIDLYKNKLTFKPDYSSYSRLNLTEKLSILLESAYHKNI